MEIWQYAVMIGFGIIVTAITIVLLAFIQHIIEGAFRR